MAERYDVIVVGGGISGGCGGLGERRGVLSVHEVPSIPVWVPSPTAPHSRQLARLGVGDGTGVADGASRRRLWGRGWAAARLLRGRSESPPGSPRCECIPTSSVKLAE